MAVTVARQKAGRTVARLLSCWHQAPSTALHQPSSNSRQSPRGLDHTVYRDASHLGVQRGAQNEEGSGTRGDNLHPHP